MSRLTCLQCLKCLNCLVFIVMSKLSCLNCHVSIVSNVLSPLSPMSFLPCLNVLSPCLVYIVSMSLCLNNFPHCLVSMYHSPLSNCPLFPIYNPQTNIDRQPVKVCRQTIKRRGHEYRPTREYNSGEDHWSCSVGRWEDLLPTSRIFRQVRQSYEEIATHFAGDHWWWTSMGPSSGNEKKVVRCFAQISLQTYL